MSHRRSVLMLAMLGAIGVGGCDRLQPVGAQDPRPPCSCLCEAADQANLQICVFDDSADAAAYTDCEAVCRAEAQGSSVWDSCESVPVQSAAYPEMCHVRTVAQSRSSAFSTRFEVDPDRSHVTIRQGHWSGTSRLTGDLGLHNAVCEGRSCEGSLRHMTLEAPGFDLRRGSSRHMRIDRLNVITDQYLGDIITSTSADGQFVIRSFVLLAVNLDAAIVNYGIKLGEGRMYSEYNMAGSVAYGTIDYETRTLTFYASVSDGDTEIEVTVTAIAELDWEIQSE